MAQLDLWYREVLEGWLTSRSAGLSESENAEPQPQPEPQPRAR